MPTETLADYVLPWHTEAWQLIQARRDRQSLPHALLLRGPQGVGKQQFAKRLSAALVCEDTDVANQPCGHCKACHLALTGNHPDIHWLQPEEPGKPIKIDAVRKMIGRTTLTTQAQGLRVFVISPADAMNRNAANALLKTLEEPSASSMLILVSSAPHRLPATILSRCQSLPFRPVDDHQTSDWLAGRVDGQTCDGLLAVAPGAPLTALRAAEEGWLGRNESLIDQLQALKLRKINPMQVVEVWSTLPLDALLDDLSRTFCDLTRLAVAGDAGRLFLPGFSSKLQSLSNDINVQGLFAYIDSFNELRQRMTHNLNPQMLLEKLIVDWLALTRRGAR
jgi:DNA polymerase III subunit delta'